MYAFAGSEVESILIEIYIFQKYMLDEKGTEGTKKFVYGTQEEMLARAKER